ncbi:MAG TPA: DMT family transporter, partial [Ktedonobacteraceae bacterium]|nr:DMT family transporter [Ktedonobacteraceae bacterium]
VFLLNTVLFSTYYAVAKEALGRIDPIVFTFFEMMALVPVALCIIVLSWPSITRQVIKRGIVLGSSLCLALFTIAIALKYTSATSTAFFPALNGFLAAFIAWLFLQQPITKATWFAGLLSVVGTALLIMNSPVGGARGSLIAFLGGLFFTGYVFLSEHEQKGHAEEWPLFGIELLTMAVWASLVVLLFGDWQSFHPALPKDVWVILYVAGACTFLPTLFTVLMQKYVSAVTVSFIYILEPILGAVAANMYLHEALPLDGYIGGGLIVAGAIIHTWSVAERPSAERTMQQWRSPGEPLWVSLLATVGYPLLFLSAGTFVLYGLGGFPPHAWHELYRFWPTLPTLMQQGQNMSAFFLVAPAACWLIAWASLAMIAFLTIYRVFRVLLFTPKAYTRDVHTARQMAVARYPVQPGTAQGAVQQWNNNQPLYSGPAYPPPIEPSIAYPQSGQS